MRNRMAGYILLFRVVTRIKKNELVGRVRILGSYAL